MTHKLQYVLAFLLTAALIAGGAYTPDLAAFLMDRSAFGQVTTASVQPIQLEFSEEETEAPYSPMQVLRLLCAGESMDMFYGETNLTEAEVRTLAAKLIEPYAQKGLLVISDSSQLTLEPRVAYDPGDLSNHRIFWALYYIQKSDGDLPYQTLTLTIDDATGRLLSIYSDVAESVFDSLDLPILSQRFADLYFEGIGLSEEAKFWESSGRVETMAHDDILCTRYTFGDVVYGELTVEFYVYSYGYQVTFSG